VASVTDMATELEPPLPNNQKPVGAVIAAVKVLRYLSDAPTPVGVSQIAKDVGLYPSTCFNILRTLVHEDLVSFDSNAKTYTLGLGIIDFARGLLSRDGFMSAIQAELHACARRGDVSMTLWRRTSNHNVVVASAPSGRVVQIHIGIGERLPPYIGATGRVVAAFDPPTRAQLRKRFETLRWENPLSFDEYLDEVELTRERGFAIDNGNFRSGLVTLATPVIDGAGRVRMMLAAHMFQGQFSAEHHEEIARGMKAMSERVEKAGSLTDYN
jgi:DNA-binding IclR family transcriptional regulator